MLRGRHDDNGKIRGNSGNNKQLKRDYWSDKKHPSIVYFDIIDNPVEGFLVTLRREIMEEIFLYSNRKMQNLILSVDIEIWKGQGKYDFHLCINPREKKVESINFM